jgi:hypothetical protein
MKRVCPSFYELLAPMYSKLVSMLLCPKGAVVHGHPDFSIDPRSSMINWHLLHGSSYNVAITLYQMLHTVLIQCMLSESKEFLLTYRLHNFTAHRQSHCLYQQDSRSNQHLEHMQAYARHLFNLDTLLHLVQCM